MMYGFDETFERYSPSPAYRGDNTSIFSAVYCSELYGAWVEAVNSHSH